MNHATSLIFRFMLTGALASTSFPTLACTEGEAFGFKFGQPVPADAKDVEVYYFMGGSYGENVLRSFSAPVPTPLAAFPEYAYFSNRDRKFVHQIFAFRQLISDKVLLNDEKYRTAVLEKAKLEIAELRDAWERAYGITYTMGSHNGLTWDGENDHVSSTIGTFGGEYLYIECTNKALREKAMSIALESLRKK